MNNAPHSYSRCYIPECAEYPEHCYVCAQPEYHENHPVMPSRWITEENTWVWCAVIVGLAAIATLLGVFL
jgi:hypothetical protein